MSRVGLFWMVIISTSLILLGQNLNPTLAREPITPLTIPPRDPVILQAPSHGSVGISIVPLLSWHTVTGATSYYVEVGNSNFTHIVFRGRTTALSITVVCPGSSPALALGTTYWWRVQAENDAGSGPWSNSWSFTTTTLSNRHWYTPIYQRVLGWSDLYAIEASWSSSSVNDFIRGQSFIWWLWRNRLWWEGEMRLASGQPMTSFYASIVPSTLYTDLPEPRVELGDEVSLGTKSPHLFIPGRNYYAGVSMVPAADPLLSVDAIVESEITDWVMFRAYWNELGRFIIPSGWYHTF